MYRKANLSHAEALKLKLKRKMKHLKAEKEKVRQHIEYLENIHPGQDGVRHVDFLRENGWKRMSGKDAKKMSKKKKLLGRWLNIFRPDDKHEYWYYFLDLKD